MTRIDPRLWDEVERLHKLGLTNKRIAEQVGISERRADRWVQKIRGHPIPQHIPTEEELKRARMFLEDGASYEEVGKTLGFAPSTIRKHIPGHAWTKEQTIQFMTDIRRAKNPEERRRISSSQLMRAKAYLEQGLSLKETAAKTGLHRDTLAKYFPKYGMSKKDKLEKAYEARLAGRMPFIKEGLRLMSEEGMSAYKAAKIVHVSANTLRKYEGKI